MNTSDAAPFSGASSSRLTATLAAAVLTAACSAATLRVLGAERTGGSTASQLGAAGSAATLVVLLLILVLVAGTWSLVADRPRAATGLSVVGLAWVLPGFASAVAFPSPVRAALVALPAAALAGTDAVVASWTTQNRPAPPDDLVRARLSPSWLSRGWLSRSLLSPVWLSAFAVLAHLLGYSPFADVACDATCEPSPAPLATLLGPRNGLGVSVLFVLAAVSVVAARALGSRGAPASVRWTALAAAAAVAVAAVLPWLTWGSSGHPAVSDGLMMFAVVVLTGGVLIAQGRVRLIRRKVAVLLDDLADGEDGGGRDGPRRAVHFTGTQIQGWVDRRGLGVEHPDARPDGAAAGSHLVLGDEAGPALRIVLGPGETAEQVLAELTPAARMALENARLDGLARARLAELRASQRRIVAATDAERSRIERDLHDGAQQRLVAVSLHLRAAAARAAPSTAAALSEAGHDVRAAVESLRDLAHGRVPAVLLDEGVAVAIRELARDCAVPVQVTTAGPLDTPPRQVTITIYLAAAAALDNVARHARATEASLTITVDPETVTLNVVDDGIGGASLGTGLTDIADRVGAIGGRMTVADATLGGTVLEVVIPCAS